MISDSSESSLRPSGRQIHDDDDDDEVVVKVGEEEVVVVEDERSLYARLCALLFPFMVIICIAASIVVATVVFRDSIVDALKAIDPSESVWRTIVFLGGGCVVVWGLVFTPVAIYFLAMGYYYKYWGFLMMVGFLMTGITFEYYAGRYICKRFLGTERLRRWFPKECKYFVSFNNSFKKQPIWLTFLVVAAPIPLGFNLMLIGLFTDTPFVPYAIGAMLSVSMNSPLVLMIGIQADNLEDALDPSESKLNFILTIIGIVFGILIAVVLPRVMYRQLTKLKNKIDDKNKKKIENPSELEKNESTPVSSTIIAL